MKKAILIGMAMSLFAFGTISPINAAENNLTNIVESEENKTFNGNYIYAAQNGDKVEITIKQTGEKITILTHDGKAYAIIDNENNIINIQSPTTRVATARKMGVPIPKGVDPSKFKYTFVKTVKVDHQLSGSMKNILIGVISFVPWVGPIFGVSALIDEVLSLGKKTLYIKYSYYYAKGYQYYKYVTRFYSDSEYKKLLKTSVDYVKMW